MRYIAKIIGILIAAIIMIIGIVTILRFSNPPVPSRDFTSVKLYYYNAQKDTDENGNLLCSSQGLQAVTRTLSVSSSPIQDTIRLLLEGELTSEEKEAGVTTEFPLSGLTLETATLENGILTLAFADPQNKTVGGSCRVSILWAQIEATAKEFPEVQSVRFTPEELFQP